MISSPLEKIAVRLCRRTRYVRFCVKPSGSWFTPHTHTHTQLLYSPETGSEKIFNEKLYS